MKRAISINCHIERLIPMASSIVKIDVLDNSPTPVGEFENNNDSATPTVVGESENIALNDAPSIIGGFNLFLYERSKY